MKIETITVMQRKNLGNYEHLEISASAKVEEGEQALTAMLSLKTWVQAVLEAKAEEISTPAPVVEEVIAPVVKEKKPKAKKEKEPEVIVESEIPPVIQEPKKKEVKTVAYDSTIAEHKSILAGYLSKKYDTAWKTVAPAEEIKAFTSSLNGQPFLDDVGNILPVFLEEIHTFFGA